MKMVFSSLILLILMIAPADAKTIHQRTYTNYCKDANAKGCWTFDDDRQDKSFDVSGNGGLLEEIGGTVAIVSGTIGNARDFEAGDTEELSHPDGGPMEISGADQAISFGLYYTPEGNDTFNETMMSDYNATGNQRGWFLFRIDGTTNVTWCRLSGNGSTSTTAIGATGLTAGTTYHIVCVYDDTDIRIYVNGVLDSNGSDNPKTYSSGIFDNTARFYIGRDGGTSNYADGKIDEAFVMDRALTAAEVLDIYNHGLK